MYYAFYMEHFQISLANITIITLMLVKLERNLRTYLKLGEIQKVIKSQIVHHINERSFLMVRLNLECSI